MPITLPRHNPIPAPYIKQLRKIIEEEDKKMRNKNLEYYMNLPYRMEIVKDPEEDGYVIIFPELKGCLTSGYTIQEAIANAEDAKRTWLTACIEDDIEIPLPDSMRNFSGQFQIRIPKELHRKLYEHAKESGVSMNQYCTMLLSMNDSSIHRYRH